MEVYYQDYARTRSSTFAPLAERFGLLPLGGSDYHGLGGPQQREPGDIPLPASRSSACSARERARGSCKRASSPS